MKKYYRCNICGNIVEMVEDSGNNPFCCGEAMHEMTPGKTEASVEHHIPQYTLCDKKIDVCVGAQPHPMTDAHKIKWIALETDCGFYYKYINPEKPAKVRFKLCDGEKPLAIYTYCNLHGLWTNMIEL